MTTCTCECTCGAAQATELANTHEASTALGEGLQSALERAVGAATGSLALNSAGIPGSVAAALGPNTTIEGA